MKSNWRQCLLIRMSSGSTISAKELAEAFSVSTRTIRSYVTKINDEIGEVIGSSHRGYRLNGSAHDVLDRLQKVQTQSVMSPADRREYIVRLCLENDGVDLYRLSDELFVSDSTIEADLVKLRTVLEANGLRLQREGSTITIDGSELDKRRLLRRAVLKSVASRQPVLDDKLIAHAMQEPEILNLRVFVLDILAKHGFAVNDTVINNLVAHIAILVQRLRHGYSVDFSVPVTVPDSARELLTELAQAINDRFSVELPEVEIRYLAFLLVENAIPDQISFAKSPTSSPFFQDSYVTLVRTIVRQIAETYLIDLDNDRFVAFLSLHIRNLVQRSRRNEVAAPPAGISIRNTHPIVYEMAVFIAHQIQQLFGIVIAEDEISLISFHVGAHFRQLQEEIDKVHIAVAIPHYYDIQQELISAIDNRVGTRAVVTRVLRELDSSRDASDSDLLVTVTPPLEELNVPVVVVSPFPTEEELARIDSVVSKLSMTKRRSRTLSALVDLFNPTLFTMSTSTETFSRPYVVEMLATQLAENGVVEDANVYAAAVDERESISPTCFSSNAAIPHSMQMEAEDSAIAVYVSPHPVDWDGQPVQLVAMLAFSEDFRKTVSEIFNNIIHALVSRQNVEFLVNESHSYDTFIRALVTVLER